MNCQVFENCKQLTLFIKVPMCIYWRINFLIYQWNIIPIADDAVSSWNYWVLERVFDWNLGLWLQEDTCTLQTEITVLVLKKLCNFLFHLKCLLFYDGQTKTKTWWCSNKQALLAIHICMLVVHSEYVEKRDGIFVRGDRKV